jgi:hypothetical protein
VAGKAVLQQRHQRGVARGIDVGRHAGGVVLEPDAVHGRLPECCRFDGSIGRRRARG